MRISRWMLNTTLALSLAHLAQAQQPGAPAIPRAQPELAPSNQPATLPAPANQPGRVQVQPGQPQPGQPLPNQPSRTTVNKPIAADQANPHSNQNASQQVASLLAICNHKEVKLAELAKSKSENKDVREFADMLIKDHNEMLGKLSQFGGQSGLGTTNTSDQTNRTTDSRPTTSGDTTPSRGLDFVAVQRQAAQQCLSKAQKKWSEHKSAECDMAYIGAQIVAHEEMINNAQALRQYASPELQKEIDKGIEAAEHHRDEAHKLIKKLGEEEQKKS